MSDNLGMWRKIQPGGTFTLSVKGKSESDKNFVAVARIVPTSGAEKQWLDHMINPGPKTLTFTANKGYSVRIGVKFLGGSKEKAVISATVTNAAGNKVKEVISKKTTYTHEVGGKSGEPVRRCTLNLFTN